ncbi:hypothetical protein Bbelb_002720 [Branchiostoma belcheri]|nr:hypothetical protein Bbelb_002720 [Branchiostoma belcheri]
MSRNHLSVEHANIRVTVITSDSRDSSLNQRSTSSVVHKTSAGNSLTPVYQRKSIKYLDVKVEYFTLNQPREICEGYGGGEAPHGPSSTTRSRRSSSSSQEMHVKGKAPSCDTNVDGKSEHRSSSAHDNSMDERRSTEKNTQLWTSTRKPDSKSHKKSSKRSRKSSTSAGAVPGRLGSSAVCNVTRVTPDSNSRPVSTFSLVLLPFKPPEIPVETVVQGRNTELKSSEPKRPSSSGVPQVNRTSEKQPSPKILHRAPWVAWGRWHEAVEDERRSEVLSSLMYKYNKTIPFPLLPLTRPLVKGSSLNKV